MPTKFEPTPQQRLLESKSREVVDLVIQARSDDVGTADEAREKLWEQNQIITMTGPPGSGKTCFTHRLIDYVLAQGGKVLFASPTAQVASRMRAKYGQAICADTCAAAFAFDDNTAFPFLAMYSLVVTDEVSQLQGNLFQRIHQLWQQANNSVVCRRSWRQMADRRLR